jgi:hypothetical protein
MAGYYSKRTSGSSGYYSSGRAEISMRDEFFRTMDGQSPELAKAMPVLHRRAVLDDDGNKTACPCIDDVTQEPDKDRYCPICLGEGYIWTETLLDCYRWLQDSNEDNSLLNFQRATGTIPVPTVVFFVKYDANVLAGDRIVEINIDNEGDLVYPIRRTKIYDINEAWPFRCDDGRVEYLKLFTHYLSVKHLNPHDWSE